MSTATPARPTRERILDAAVSVMRDRGLVNATVRTIVREAGYSEALLYKYFADKQELFLAVLKERLLPPVLASPRFGGDLRSDLVAAVAGLMRYFAQMFPIAGSLFGAPELLAAHRERLTELGAGPEGPIRMIAARIRSAPDVARLPVGADVDAVAELLVGAAFQQGFLAAYAGSMTVTDAEERARRLVAQVLGRA